MKEKTNGARPQPRALPSELVELLPLDQCYISEQNTRTKPTVADPEIQSLALSLNSVGQITPGIVRKTEKGYEICAGARRLVAANVANLPHFSAVVRKMTDDEFEEQLLVENLQREDPDPRAEAKLVARLVKRGLQTPEQISAHVGKPKHWAIRRLQLLNVIAPILEAWQAGKNPFTNYTVQMMELIGSLPEATQADIARADKYEVAHWRSRAELSTAIARRFVCRLEKPPFDLNDPKTFVKGCGPGCACDSRKQGALLFGDQLAGKDGRCLNPSCFNARAAKAKEATLAAITAKHGKLPVVTADYLGFDYKLEVGDKRIAPERVYTAPSPKPKKKDDRKVTVVHKSGNISVGYLPKEKPIAGGHTTKPEKSKKQSLTARKNILRGKRLLKIHEQLEKALRASVRNDCHEDVIDLATIFGLPWREETGYGQKRPWAAFDARKKLGYPVTPRSSRLYVLSKGDATFFKSREEALWHGLKLVFEEMMNPTGNVGDAVRHESDLRRVAKLISFDYAGAQKRVNQEIRPPKSWGSVDIDTLEPISVRDLLSPIAKRIGKKRPQKRAKKGGAK